MQDAWTPDKVIWGIRHVRTFSVSDIFGDIIDKIVPLQGYGSYPTDCFAKIARSANTIVIQDKENTLSINCGIDGVIMECDMQAEPKIPTNTLKEMFNEIVNYVLPLSEGKNKINRLGLVHIYDISPFDNSAKRLVSDILNIDLKGTPDDVFIRFALKNPAAEAIYEPDKKADYKNVIIEISSQKEKEEDIGSPSRIRLSIDYQLYFTPVRTLNDVDISEHLSNAESYINDIIKKSKLNIQSSFVKHE